jgi:hypothetical protein
MKRHLLTILFLGFVIYSYGQHTIIKPDFKMIAKTIERKKSDKYYPKLLARFQNNDTTFSDDDYSLLYYGSLLQDGYSPYGGSDYSDSTEKIFEQNDISLADYDRAINFENLSLKENPFSLRDLNILAYSYSKSGEDSLSNLINFKKDKLIKTILSTGDGKTELTAFYVAAVSHEYDMLQIMGFDFDGSQSITKSGCDYLTLKENKYGVKGIYFDVNKILEIEAKLTKKK